jgi:hypothetical protein
VTDYDINGEKRVYGVEWRWLGVSTSCRTVNVFARLPAICLAANRGLRVMRNQDASNWVLWRLPGLDWRVMEAQWKGGQLEGTTLQDAERSDRG